MAEINIDSEYENVDAYADLRMETRESPMYTKYKGVQQSVEQPPNHVTDGPDGQETKKEIISIKKLLVLLFIFILLLVIVIIVCVVVMLSWRNQMEIANDERKLERTMRETLQDQAQKLEKHVNGIDIEVDALKDQHNKTELNMRETLQDQAQELEKLVHKIDIEVDALKDQQNKTELNMRETLQDQAQELEKLVREIDIEVDALKDQQNKTAIAVEQKVGFYARLHDSVNITEKSNIVFPVVLINIGLCYDNKKGLFTAPIDGIFKFGIQIITKKGSANYFFLSNIRGSRNDKLFLHCSLGLNFNLNICRANMLFLLKKGDIVNVLASRFETLHYNSYFYGYLIK